MASKSREVFDGPSEHSWDFPGYFGDCRRYQELQCFSVSEHGKQNSRSTKTINIQPAGRHPRVLTFCVKPLSVRCCFKSELVKTCKAEPAGLGRTVLPAKSVINTKDQLKGSRNIPPVNDSTKLIKLPSFPDLSSWPRSPRTVACQCTMSSSQASEDSVRSIDLNIPSGRFTSNSSGPHCRWKSKTMEVQDDEITKCLTLVVGACEDILLVSSPVWDRDAPADRWSAPADRWSALRGRRPGFVTTRWGSPSATDPPIP